MWDSSSPSSRRGAALRGALALLGILVVLIGPSCTEDECTDGYKPVDCVEARPAEGTLRVQLSIDGLNPAVPVVVYSGTIEQNNVVFTDTLRVTPVEYRLPNGRYAVRARYRSVMGRDTVTLYAIDGGLLEEASTDYCDGTCYREGVLSLDVVRN